MKPRFLGVYSPFCAALFAWFVACGGNAAWPAPETVGAGGARAAAAAPPTARTEPKRAPAEIARGVLTPERAVHFKRISDLRFSPDGARLAYVVTSATDDGPESHLFMLDVRAGEARPFTFSRKSERSPRWSPDGRTLAFVSTRGGEAQIYGIAVDGGEATAWTTAEDGVGDFVWSPDGKRIAFLARGSKDDDKAKDARVSDREQDLERVWIFDVASKKARVLTGGPFRVDEIAWPAAERIVALVNDHPKTEAWDGAIYDVNAGDGSFRVLARPPPPFRSLTPSPSGARLAYVGTDTKGPTPHDLFVADPAGAAQNRSKALDRAVIDVRWQDDATIILRASDGFRTRLFRAAANGPPQAIDLPYSVRAFDVARDGTIAFVGVGFDRLPELFVKGKAGPARQIGRTQDAAWASITLGDPEIFRVKSFDGTEIEAALLPATPGGPDKRPLVLLVHGGPNSCFSADYFWFNAWPHLLAARGFDVLLVNPRGSTGYGEAFVRANRADWGGGDYKDLISVLDQVIARGHTDEGRLGVGGWSYGGEMTAWAIGHTTRFKAAVVGAGVFDQAAEFRTEDEPAGDEWHFGTPWDHPDVFAKNSPSTFIRNAKTPTLIVHGDADRNNPVGQSQALYRALKHFGVESELVVYPGEPHGPRKAKHQVDIMERMIRWYEGHLK